MNGGGQPAGGSAAVPAEAETGRRSSDDDNGGGPSGREGSADRTGTDATAHGASGRDGDRGTAKRRRLLDGTSMAAGGVDGPGGNTRPSSAPQALPPPHGHPPPTAAVSAATLLDSLPGMVFAYQVHPDGSAALAYASSYSRTLLGVAPEEIVSSHHHHPNAKGGGENNEPEAVLSRIVPEDRPGFRQTLADCLREEGAVWEWTGRMTRKRRRRRRRRRRRGPTGTNGTDGHADNSAGSAHHGSGSGEEEDGEDGEEDEVRMVKFTSSCPPIRKAVMSSACTGGADGGENTTSTEPQYTTVFHGIALDVTPPSPSPAPAPAAPIAMGAPLPPTSAAAATASSSSDSSAPVPSTSRPAPTTVSAAIATTTTPSSPSSSSPSDTRALSSAIATLRSVLDSAPHPVIALDARGTVTEWNRTAEVLTGYAKAEAVGKRFAAEFVVGACRKEVLRMLDDVAHLAAERQVAAAAAAAAEGGANGTTAGAKGGGPARKTRPTMAAAGGARAGAAAAATTEADPSCEATLQTKPGHPPVHLLLTASPKRVEPATSAAASASGPTNGTVIIAQDMSKQHAALALHRSETEKGIMEWLSHEVRNPLSVAVEASRTLKEDPSDDPEENSNNLELICLSLGYIVELLTDMLDLNKCAEGKIAINPTVCRLREDIVLPTKRMLDARRKSVDLIIDGGEEIWAYVDRLRLQQVLTNLIVNSMKYTSIGFIRVGIRRISREEIGGVHLECATGTDRAQLDNKPAADSAAVPTMNSLFGGGADSQMVAVTSPSVQNDYYGEEGGVLISVSDSGSGIDPSNYQNLFERWEKLGSKTNGTGIGLCLCRSLMEVMGGRIFLSKTYNSGIPGNPGCQFCIVLPPTALDGTAAAADYQAGGGGSSEDVSICTAALSKRLSRDKNKPESVLKTVSSYDKLASTALPQSASLPVDTDDLRTSNMWKQNGGFEAGAPSQYLLENGDAGRDIKKVSFAPQLDDAHSHPPLHAQNPYKPAGFSYDNGAGAQSPLPDSGAAFNGSTPASTSLIPVSNAGAASPGSKMGGNSMAVAPASAVTANAASSTHHHHQAPTDDPFHNTCLSGKFRLLVVDDDETFRIMFVRRLKRMFPNGIVDESPSGEDSIEKAKKNVYDLVTMDHFMALDELNGADTIRALRSNNCDACIVGISGNTKTVHHLEAGADDFIRKPVPTDRRFIRRLVSKMSPPSVWKVLIADDCKLNLKFMHRKLIKVASPHYTTKQESDKRWQFALKTNGEDCVDCLKEEWFDLCVLDQHMGPGLKGTDVASFIRKGAVNPNAIVVINTGVEKNLQEQGNWDDHTVPFNFQWTKPAPSIEKIRQDLCLELVAEKTSSGANFGESLTKAALLKASVINGDAGLVREGEEDGTSSVISEGSVVDFDSNASGKEETRQLPEHQKVLQKLYDEIGDELAFSDMCTLFVTTVPSQLDTIDESLNGHDWNNLSLILHKLKGTLQVFHIDACVALIKPLYEQSLVLKSRGQKRKQGDDVPCDDVSSKEFEQMHQSCSQLRSDIVSVIRVCQGVVDNGA